MLCILCKGSGSLMAFKGKPHWWDCPACVGAGVSEMHGPATILIKKFKAKNWKKSKKVGPPGFVGPAGFKGPDGVVINVK